MFEYYEVRFKFTPAPLQLQYSRYDVLHCRPQNGRHVYESWKYMGQNTARHRLAPGREPSFPHPGVRRLFGVVQIMYIIIVFIFHIFIKKRLTR